MQMWKTDIKMNVMINKDKNKARNQINQGTKVFGN